MTQEETPEDRRARIRAEYDAAIREHRLNNKRRTERQRKERPEYRELQRRAAQRSKERRAAQRLINPPKPPGRPRAPTDGLTREQIAKREKDRERSAKYRQQCRGAQQRLKKALQKPQRGAQTHEEGKDGTTIHQTPQTPTEGK